MQNTHGIQTTQRSFHQYHFLKLLHLKFDITILKKMNQPNLFTHRCSSAGGALHRVDGVVGAEGPLSPEGDG